MEVCSRWRDDTTAGRYVYTGFGFRTNNCYGGLQQSERTMDRKTVYSPLFLFHLLTHHTWFSSLLLFMFLRDRLNLYSNTCINSALINSSRNIVRPAESLFSVERHRSARSSMAHPALQTLPSLESEKRALSGASEVFILLILFILLYLVLIAI